MPPRLLPLQAASTASYDASQPYMKVGFIQEPRLIPQNYIKAASRPPGLFQSLHIRTSNRIRNHRRRIEEPAIKKKTSSPSSLGIESSFELELEEREKRRIFRRSFGLSDLLQHLVPVDSSSSRSCI
jgi:hypothetical protein